MENNPRQIAALQKVLWRSQSSPDSCTVSTIIHSIRCICCNDSCSRCKCFPQVCWFGILSSYSNSVSPQHLNFVGTFLIKLVFMPTHFAWLGNTFSVDVLIMPYKIYNARLLRDQVKTKGEEIHVLNCSYSAICLTVWCATGFK